MTSNWLLILLVLGCGVTNPEFADYEEATSTGPAASTTECGGAALSLFETNLGSATDTVCATSGCHGSGGSGTAGSFSVTFTAGSHDANRIALYAYTGTDATTFNSFISSTQHKGGDQSSSYPAASVTTWLTKEAECL